MKIQCPQCNQVQNASAQFCNHCGVKFVVQPIKKAGIGLPVVVVLIVIGFCALCGLIGTIADKNKTSNTMPTALSSNSAEKQTTATPLPSPLTFAELKAKTNELLKFQKDEYVAEDLQQFDNVMQPLRAIPKESKDYKEAQVLIKKLIDKTAPIGAEIVVLGPKPKNSPYDGRVDAVVTYLKANLNDYDDSEWLEWSPVIKMKIKNEPFWAVRLKLRAKNAFGGKIVKDVVFFIRNNQVVTTTGL